MSKISNSESILMMELTQLERDLKAHEGYLHRNRLTPEGYKKWYARKRSLLGKIKLRKQKCGILMTDTDFDKFLLTLDKENYSGSYLLDDDVVKRFTIRQKNILYDIAANNHMK